MAVSRLLYGLKTIVFVWQADGLEGIIDGLGSNHNGLEGISVGFQGINDGLEAYACLEGFNGGLERISDGLEAINGISHVHVHTCAYI